MKGLFIISLFVFPALILSFQGTNVLVAAQDEDVDDDLVDVEGDVESDDTAMTDEGGEGDEGKDDKTGGSPDADVTVLFTKPLVNSGSTAELPAGHLVNFLVGFTNKGNQDMVLETLDASFRYLMDFNYYIQNFSTLAYERTVKPGHEATLDYSFVPAEAFAGRPFGLSINLKYRDAIGNQFYEGVYNETVNIVEIEEGLDGETFFLYVFLGACGVLLLVLGQQFLVSVGKKRVGSTTKKPVVETGTTNPNDVDYDWLPKETLQSLNKSPRVRTIKQSPRQRKVKRSAGADD
uniref:Translocon-associated protein subunit alpha n=1 Tax=Clastoptera arizonana TaxID=38151 RepID=A0A1B6CHQ9_9HEMI